MAAQVCNPVIAVVGVSHLTLSGNRASLRIMDNVIKDSDFKLITEIQRPDAKKRLSIGQAMEGPAAAYNIYRNSLGQIVLDPVKAVPVYEACPVEMEVSGG